MDYAVDLSYLHTYKEDGLREIIYDNAEQYESFALEAAKKELYSRYERLFSADPAELLPFARLLPSLNFDSISPFLEPYLKGARVDPSLYRAAFEKLLRLEPDESRHFVLSTKINAPSGLLDGTGQEPDGEDEVDLTFLTWREWLSVRINKEQILRIGPERIGALALYKMTVNGFDEEDTQRCRDNLRVLSETNFEPVEEEGEDEDDRDDYDEEDEEPVNGGNADFLAQGLLQVKKDIKKKKARKKEIQVRPWVRFFARSFDYSAINLFLNGCCLLSCGKTLNNFIFYKYISVDAILCIILESILLSTVGTTPGKWLLRVVVRKGDGTKAKFTEALYRSFLVWVAGNGCEVIFLSTVVPLINYFYLKNKKRTWYDEKADFQVTYEDLGFLRTLVFVFLELGIFVLCFIMIKATWKM